MSLLIVGQNLSDCPPLAHLIIAALPLCVFVRIQWHAVINRRKGTLKCAFGVALYDDDRPELFIHDVVKLRATRHTELSQTAAGSS